MFCNSKLSEAIQILIPKVKKKTQDEKKNSKEKCTNKEQYKTKSFR